MPAPQRKPTKKAPAKKQPGTFARLRAEANASAEVEPYVIDDVEPPIEIAPPESVEQQIALLELFDAEGTFRVADARKILELVCGAAFPQVWQLFRQEKIGVLLALIKDMSRHWDEQNALIGEGEAEDFPGGSGASSD